MKDEKCLKCGLSNYELKNSKGNAGTHCTWCAATDKAEASKREKILQEKLTEAETLLSRLPKALTKDGVEVIAYVSVVWFFTVDGQIFSSCKWENGSSSWRTGSAIQWFVEFGSFNPPFKRGIGICYSTEAAAIEAYNNFRAKNKIEGL